MTDSAARSGDAAPAAPPSRSAEMTASVPPARRWAWTLAKAIVSLVLVYWVLRGTDLRDVARALRSASPSLLALAFGLQVLGYYISAIRWRVLLRAQNVAASTGVLFASCLVGTFFNNLLPSTVGGDVVRAYDGWRLGATKAGSLAVIFVDRFLGVVALTAFAVVAAVSSERIAARMPGTLPVLLAAAALLAVGVAWIFAPAGRVGAPGVAARLPLPRRARELAGSVVRAFGAFRGRGDALAWGLGLSLLLQTNVVIYYYVMVLSLGLPVPLGSLFLIVPLALFAMMLPISVNAIGIRENVFAFFFALYGVGAAEAVAYAWIAYGLVLLNGLLGAVVYALRR